MTIKKSEQEDEKFFIVVVGTDQARSIDLGRRFQIHLDRIKLGNTEQMDIQIGLGWPQRCHIEVFCKNETWFVQELGTYHHLSVNGVSVQKFKISDGDLIQVGDMLFEFSSSFGKKFEFFEDTERSRQEDILTRTYNRGYIQSLIQWEINRYKQKPSNRRRQSVPALPPMSLIMLDIDYFGEFNKKYDHQIGDEVLKCVVERVKTRIRSTDILARIGGEEFLIYLSDTTLERATEVAEQVRAQVAAQPFQVSNTESVPITISLGVSQYLITMDYSSFVRDANQKMLTAKNTGRNRVVY